ncbi:MAG: RNA polymerase-associated protein RapA [Lentisphaerae bacterium ADurb.BinA184]|nr:MAG: RNA polymerase-associated protein RapA [Lentisphaerae bacterium ADurb.BinA184]
MASDLHKSLAALAGKHAWDNGMRAFRDGAVLDASPNGKVTEVRVANSTGRFERVQLRFRKNEVSARCSCSWRVTPFCEHAVASLLFLNTGNPAIQAAVAEMAAAEEKEIEAEAEGAAAAEDVPSAQSIMPPARKHTLRALLLQSSSPAHLEVCVDGPAPSLESRWNRIELRVDLVFEMRKYSASNIKRLVEVGTGAGGMRLTDFSLQEQQFMRLLLTQAEMVGARYVLGAYDVADMFHCLTGFHNLLSGEGRLHLHAEPIELLFVSKGEDEYFRVLPRFGLPEHGLLPQKGAKMVIARGGAWVGLGCDYWWMPGVSDPSWLRCFLTGESITMTPEDIGRLSKACEDRRLPARLVPDAEALELHAAHGQCSPVLTLDWSNVGVMAKLEFEYGGKRVEIEGPDVLWEKKRFISRDSRAERAALDTLRDLGFIRYPQRKDSYVLREPERLWEFLDKGVTSLDSNWQIYYSSRFSRNRMSSGHITFNVTTRAESNTWFDLDCDLRSADGEAINLDEVLAAIRNRQEYLRLKTGALATIPAGLRQSLEILLGRAEQQTGNRLRFGRYAAVPVEMAVSPFSDGAGAAWRKVCERLSQPVVAGNLHVPNPVGDMLRDYQKDGVAWLGLLEDCGFHAVLADEMGLGKTIQALAVLARRQALKLTDKPTLVVCPTSLVENWLMEAQRFAPQLRAVAVHGAERRDIISQFDQIDLAITSYALLRRDIEAYQPVEFDYVILDEAQHIKNPDTVNARTCKSLRSDHRLILTGTPVENAMYEIWSLFDFLLPGMLGSRQQFRDRYEAPAAEGAGKAMAEELARQIRPFILRRTKKDVLSQLPPKMEQLVYCELEATQRQLYDSILRAGNTLLQRARKENWQTSRFELLALLMRLRQVCCHPQLVPLQAAAKVKTSAKLDHLMALLPEMLAEGRRVLVFSQFTSMLTLIEAELKKRGIPYEYLDGATKNRLDKVNRFNADPSIPIFLISLKAGGTGLNLTGADTVIHYDQWWNPMVEDQATDRTHRIGQLNTVTAIKLVARHTVEEKILKLQDEKRELFNQLVGGAQSRLGELTAEDFEFLLG